MYDATFEINDDEIDVKEIMKVIRDNILRRQEVGIYPANTDTMELESHFKINIEGANQQKNIIHHDIMILDSEWDIQNNSYIISSHRPLVGKYLVKGRNLIHGEVRRYVDPVFQKQTSFNQITSHILQDTAKRLFKIEEHYTALEQQIPDPEFLLNTIRDESNQKIHNRITEEWAKVEKQNKTNAEAIRDETKDAIKQIKSEIQECLTQHDNTIKDETRNIIEEIKSEIQEYLTQHDNTIKDETRNIIEEIKSEIQEYLTQHDNTIKEETRNIIEEIKSEVEKNIREQLRMDLLAMEADLENKAWLARVLDEKIISRDMRSKYPSDDKSTSNTGMNYFVFSEEIGKSWVKIGGCSCESSNIFDDVLQLFDSCRNVIDIGCGKGTLLLKLKSKNIGCYGIDMDETSLIYCKRYGLNFQLSDAVDHLQSLEDRTLDGVFIGQLLEHMPADTIYNLIRLSYEKMQYGSYIVIVVPNILSVLVSTNLFYLDPTHLTHIHPEVIKFILNSCGFRDMQEKFYQPISDDIKLRYIDSVNLPDDIAYKEILKNINSNTEKLNNLLFGYRDYCVIAKK